MSAVYFCWLCDRPVPELFARLLSLPDYETPGRIVRFCSAPHQAEYRQLLLL